MEDYTLLLLASLSFLFEVTNVLPSIMVFPTLCVDVSFGGNEHLDVRQASRRNFITLHFSKMR